MAQINNAALNMRRSEKDFLLRKKIKYAERYYGDKKISPSF
jgi:hypothetical protein